MNARQPDECRTGEGERLTVPNEETVDEDGDTVQAEDGVEGCRCREGRG